MGQRADEVGQAKRSTDWDAQPSGTETNRADTAALAGHADGPPSISDDDIEGTRAQIEQTREQMAATIDAIQEKLDPQNLKAQAVQTLRTATIGKVEELKGTTGGKVEETLHTISNKAQEAKSTLTDKAQEAGSVVGSKVQEAQSTVRPYAETAQTSISSTTSTVGDKALTVTAKVRDGARRAGGMAQANGPQLVQMVKRNPLPVALLVGSGLILLLYRPRDQHKSGGISTETPPL